MTTGSNRNIEVISDVAPDSLAKDIVACTSRHKQADSSEKIPLLFDVIDLDMVKTLCESNDTLKLSFRYWETTITLSYTDELFTVSCE